MKGSEYRDTEEAFDDEREAVEAYDGEIRFSSGDVVYEPMQSQTVEQIAPLDPVCACVLRASQDHGTQRAQR